MKSLLKNFTILYVEDEEMVRKSAVEYLSRVCKEVLQAKDGKEAIKVWSEFKPDIIIITEIKPEINFSTENLILARFLAKLSRPIFFMKRPMSLPTIRPIIRPIIKIAIAITTLLIIVLDAKRTSVVALVRLVILFVNLMRRLFSL